MNFLPTPKTANLCNFSLNQDVNNPNFCETRKQKCDSAQASAQVPRSPVTSCVETGDKPVSRFQSSSGTCSKRVVFARDICQWGVALWDKQIAGIAGTWSKTYRTRDGSVKGCCVSDLKCLIYIYICFLKHAEREMFLFTLRWSRLCTCEWELRLEDCPLLALGEEVETLGEGFFLSFFVTSVECGIKGIWNIWHLFE